MTSVASNFLIFNFFLINRKTLKWHTLSDFSHFFIFFLFCWNMAQKSENSWIFNGEEKKNLIRTHFRLTNLVRRFTQGRWRCGGIFFGWEGGGLYFSRCGRSSIHFWSWLTFLDFPEGLSCRESTVDESSGKTVPYRPWKSRILERVRGRRRRRENWYGKGGVNLLE